MLELQGDILEGGGQILRNASSLSCILNKPIAIQKIRAKRSNPGLRPQHLTGFQLLGDVCKADLSGAHVNSTEISMTPSGRIFGGKFSKEVGTAGSLVLLLQSTLPVSIFAESSTTLHLGGGTNADLAPSIDYFMSVFLPVVARMGVNCQCRLLRRGFYPKGGGQVEVTIEPIPSLKSITLTERGTLTRITGLSYVAGQLPDKIAHVMADTAKSLLVKSLAPSAPVIDIKIVRETQDTSHGTGTGIFLVAETSTGCRFGGTGIGRKGAPAEQVGKEAADQLLDAVGSMGCVDEHLQDQLIIFMALAKGTSEILSGKISMHTETAIHFAELLTGVKFELKPQEDGTVYIRCQGIGFER